jgi:hypothetical protein
MAIIKKYEEKALLGMWISTAIMENCMKDFQKTKSRSTMCSTYPISGYTSKENEISIQKR